MKAKLSPATASTVVTGAWSEEFTKPHHATALVLDEATWARDDAERGHREAITESLSTHTSDWARRGVPEMLEELSGLGMSWSGLARVLDVSVSGIRKWRKGSPASPESRAALAGFMAFLELLREMPVADPVQWLEMGLPLGERYRVTPLDLCAKGHVIPVLMYAWDRLTAKQLMDESCPDWAVSIQSEFEVFVDEDGVNSIRRRQG